MSAKGGYGIEDVNDASVEMDGIAIRPDGVCTNNLNMYGIGRMSSLVTVLHSVSGDMPFKVTKYVKKHSIGVSKV